MTSRRIQMLALIVGGLLVLVPQFKSCELESFNVFKTTNKDASIVFIEESSERDLDFAVLLQNKKWIDSLAERNIAYRVYDKDQTEAEAFLKSCKTIPCLLFVDKDRKVIESMSLPKTAKEANEAIMKVIGR